MKYYREEVLPLPSGQQIACVLLLALSGLFLLMTVSLHTRMDQMACAIKYPIENRSSGRNFLFESSRDLPAPQTSVAQDLAYLRDNFEAMSAKIESMALENKVLVLQDSVQKDFVRRSNSRKRVIHRLHQQRRNWVGRPTFTMNDLVHQKSPDFIWTKYHQYISEKGLPTSDAQIDWILNLLRDSRVVKVGEVERGTQVKLELTFEQNIVAIAKPMRVSRDYQTPSNHFYFNDVERHNAEIASFHLDRLLRLYRVPPTVGRRFNISSEIRAKAHEDLLSTFFISPVGNVCFRGQCKTYCDTAHAVCAINGDILEASVQLLLPSDLQITWVRMTHPFRRSYSVKHFAEWETNPDFCAENVLTDENFHSRLILDMTDCCIFDFLIGNSDRHHLMKINELGVNSTIFHIDHGRSFGNHQYDDLSILAPLKQCCLVRYSTIKTLMSFSAEGDNSLGMQLQLSLLKDPVSPVLLDEHFVAVNRRLVIVANAINQCIQNVGTILRVVIDDGL